ncbi:MAG: STAS/SEC14 domain-containing protein [Gammaproteobacteria bacterium]|nr:STAS/SEC14 domain-containing protein [Gammaproteobacteria bacterium]
MPYTLNYNHSLQLVEVVYTGKVTADELRESTSKAIALGKKHGDADALVDGTEMELVASSVDLLDLPAHQYEAEKMSRRVRVAFVLPKLSKELENSKFYETASVNRGWQVRLFPNRNEAIEWLTTKR